MATGDHPGIPYLEARRSDGSPMYTAGRRGKTPRWIVIHDMEEEETPRTAEAVAQYFHTGAGGRSVSSHYTADADSIVQCVPLSASAWTVGNRRGNDEGINWELAGFGSQSRAQWLDPYGRAMFARIAPIIRADAQRYGIPLRTLTDDQVRALEPGISSHAQLARVFGGSDHTDPGPGFPWDHLMALLTASTVEEDMPYMVRSGEKDGTVVLVHGVLAPATGKVAAHHITSVPVYEAYKAAGMQVVQLPDGVNVDEVGIYDLEPGPMPSGGEGGTSALRLELTGTGVPVSG